MLCDHCAKSSLNIGNCAYFGLPPIFNPIYRYLDVFSCIKIKYFVPCSTVLTHHSIPAIVFDVNCPPHLYSNVECGHEKQGGHLVQTLSRGRLFSRLVIVQDTDTTQGWEVHGDSRCSQETTDPAPLVQDPTSPHD